MYTRNTGELSTNIPLTKEAIEIIKKTLKTGPLNHSKTYVNVFGDNFDDVASQKAEQGYSIICLPGEETILFDDYYDNQFSDSIKNTIEQLAAIGYVINGYVEQSKRFAPKWQVEIVNNEVTILTAFEVKIRDSTDDDLIRTLERRGYVVRKDDVKPGMEISRAIELLKSIVDHVACANDTPDTINELMEMGFDNDDLLYFGFTKEEILDATE